MIKIFMEVPKKHTGNTTTRSPQQFTERRHNQASPPSNQSVIDAV